MTGPGTVYLIHFDEPYRHARHYLGWAADLERRIAHHRAGNGARLLEVVNGAGIGWRVVRTWEAGRTREAQLKRQGSRARLCPICRGGGRGE